MSLPKLELQPDDLADWELYERLAEFVAEESVKRNCEPQDLTIEVTPGPTFKVVEVEREN